MVERSPQIAELTTVVRAFERFNEPLNLVTDSAYVAVTIRAEHAWLKKVSNPNLHQLLSKLLLSHREYPYHVMYVGSHTNLPGPITEENRRTDTLAVPVRTPNVPNTFAQAKLSHQFYHQNAPALRRMFDLSCELVKEIVATCPSCQSYQMPSHGTGVNTRGLEACWIWQTDVTHVPSFGRLKYVHMSVDAFSDAVYASAHAGEKA